VSEVDILTPHIRFFEEFEAANKLQCGSMDAVLESELLAEIHRQSPPDFMKRYAEFRETMDQEALGEDRREELLLMIARREEANVERLKYVIELARRRGMAPLELWSQLGLCPDNE
jgi:hypothetical protein